MKKVYNLLLLCCFSTVAIKCDHDLMAQVNPAYKQVITFMENIDHEQDLKFLLGKSFNAKLASEFSTESSYLKFNIGQFLYSLSCKGGDDGCEKYCRKSLSFLSDPLENVETYLSPHRPELILILSEKKDAYLECIIRFNTGYDDNDTDLLSFGKVVIYKFCAQENEVALITRQEQFLN